MKGNTKMKRIGVRLAETQWRQIRSAARARGRSVNAFIIGAAVAAAGNAADRTDLDPDDFEALCRAARYGGGTEPKRGYWKVGFTFAKNLARYLGTGPGTAAKLRELKELLATLDPQGSRRPPEPLLRWFGRHFPDKLKLVRSRCQSHFAQGFFDAYDGGFTKLKR
jgi:uncharacterized protein (DUF1778 family)